MTAAKRLANFLALSQTNYRVIPHNATETAAETARVAHLAAARVAKSVLLRDRGSGRYLIALAPACNRVELDWVREGARVDPVLAQEAELGEVFPDCTLGAVPGFGQAYQLEIVWDDELGEQPSVYLEAGDHEELIEIDRDEFHRLFDAFPHGVISQLAESYLAYHAREFRDPPH